MNTYSPDKKTKAYIAQGHGGGSKKFLNLMSAYLESRNEWELVDTDADVILFNAWTQPILSVLNVMKDNPTAAIVHRIDGSGRLYGRQDNCDDVQSSVNRFADITIFQSDFSKQTTTDMGIIKSNGNVIYNPVDTNPYAVAKRWKGDTTLKVITVSNSKNKLKGIHHIPKIAEKFRDIQFHIAGPFTDLPTQPNLFVHHGLNWDSYLKLLTEMDIFMNLSENDPCPNVILEGMSAGLPVAYVNSGGVPELVGDCGQIITPHSDKLDHELKKLATSSISKHSIIRCQEKFSLNHILSQYEDQLIKAARKARRNLLTTRFKRFVWAVQRKFGIS